MTGTEAACPIVPGGGAPSSTRSTRALSAARHGWPTDLWLPFPPSADRCNVETERGDETSTLHLYRRLLHARRGSDALRAGVQRLLDASEVPPDVLGWVRRSGADERLVLVSFGDSPVRVDAGRGRVVEVATGEGAPFDGLLGADRAVVLR